MLHEKTFLNLSDSDSQPRYEKEKQTPQTGNPIPEFKPYIDLKTRLSKQNNVDRKNMSMLEHYILFEINVLPEQKRFLDGKNPFFDRMTDIEKELALKFMDDYWKEVAKQKERE